MSTLEDQDHLRCPICIEYSIGAVYQCRNGHTICEKCTELIPSCPQCRVPFGANKIRNRVVEALLERVTVECPNQEHECSAKMIRKSLDSHLKSCEYRDTEFCKFIGFKTCDHVCRDPLSILMHITEDHGMQRMRRPPKASFSLRNIRIAITSSDNVSYSGRIIWDTCLEEEDFVTTFVLFTLIDGERGDYSFVCLHLGKDDSREFEIDFAIFNSSSNTPLWKWSGKPCDFRDVRRVVKNPPFRIPLQYLTDHIEGLTLTDFSLDIEVAVRRRDATLN